MGREPGGLDVAVVDDAQIQELVDHLGDEAGLVVLGEPVIEGEPTRRLGWGRRVGRSYWPPQVPCPEPAWPDPLR
jgi:hypothetical protein